MADPNATGFDVDAAEKEYNEARSEAGAAAQTDDELDEGADGNQAPPGFLSFEEYVEQGGDPDMYRGRKAFESEHERIEENKRLRKDIRGFQNTVQQTMEAVNEWKGNERTKMRAEVEASLHRAMEDEDPQAAIDAQKKLDAIDDAPAVSRPEHPVITEFRSVHSALDADSEDFDQELNADVEAYFNDLAGVLSQNNRRQLTDNQVTRVLRKALKDALELHGYDGAADGADGADGADDDKPTGESPRNSRGRSAGPKRRARQQPAKPKAENFVLENPMNERQTHAAPEVRDMIGQKARDAAKKAGLTDADADKRAKEATERFEEAIHR